MFSADSGYAVEASHYLSSMLLDVVEIDDLLDMRSAHAMSTRFGRTKSKEEFSPHCHVKCEGHQQFLPTYLIVPAKRLCRIY